MKISIVICVYNDATRFLRALESVEKQSQQPYEIVVIDDCSLVPLKIDKTYDFKISLIRNQVNMGVGYSRNIGAWSSTGDIICFLDSDDWWQPNWLSMLYKTFNCYADVSVVAGQIVVYSEKGGYLANSSSCGSKFKVYKWWYPLIKSLPQTSATAIRRNDIVSFRNMRHSEDIDFFCRSAIASQKNLILLDCIAGYCDRAQLSKGGLSGMRYKMRTGQLVTFLKLIKISAIVLFLSVLFLITLPIRVLKNG